MTDWQRAAQPLTPADFYEPPPGPTCYEDRNPEDTRHDE